MIKLGEKKTVIYCEDTDVQDLIRKEYDMLDFSLVAAESSGNNQSLEFNVQKGHNDPYDKEQIADKNWLFNTNVYLNDLADRDVIEEGTYIINIFW